MIGPQRLLNAATEVTEVRIGRQPYYAFADDEHVYICDEDAEKWRHACFADLSCIQSKPIGTPAFLSLRVGTNQQGEAVEAFIRWLFDPQLSPWREYTDELLPTKPMFLFWKGEMVNIHSHEFRRDVGVMLLKHVSRRVAINFLKTYRLLGEHPEFIQVWYEMCQAGMNPTDAFWSAQFCYPNKITYKVPHHYDHNIFNWSGGSGDVMFTELMNMRDGMLRRDLYENDASMLERSKVRSDESYGFRGCDLIWQEKHPDTRQINFNGSLRDAILTRTKSNPLKVLISGGLRSRGADVDDPYMDKTRTLPKAQVIEMFQTMIHETLGALQ